MQNWIIQVLNQFGYVGILLLVAVENIFPPIPSEVILTFGGFMTTYTSMNIWFVILFATVGSVLGAIVLYLIGRWISSEKLQQFFESRFGKLLRIKKDDVYKATAWFSKKGMSTVFFCRFIPIVRSLISIPAGIAKMNLAKFLILTAVGTFIWNAVLVYLGALAGESWIKIIGYMNTYSKIALLLLFILVVLLGVVYYKRRILKKTKQ
ncbi:MAG: DedA family protein [Clostridiales bacterium]|nr:DedA family protein [Clostridiales bacterium]